MDTLQSAYYLGCEGGKNGEHGGKDSKLSYPEQVARGLFGFMGRTRQAANGRMDAAELERQLRIQRLRMEAASTAREWKNAAERLDNLEGNHWWKFQEDSDDCNIELIRDRLEKLKEANHEGDFKKMMSLIRTSMARDLGGMCNIRLYQHTWHGTKTLIEEYTEVVKYTIDQITNYCEEEDLTADELEEFLIQMKEARQSFGQSALLLSGGGTLGMCHMGVIKCLLQENLLPRIICGSSAGSIVGSVVCCEKEADILPKLEEISRRDLKVFQGIDEIQGVPGMALNLLQGKAVFHVKHLCREMQELLGDITFKEAFNHTGRILNIHVSCKDRHNLPRLLNYQTAPNVVIWSAVASSSAVPWVFDAPGLQSKDPETNVIGPWGHLDHTWIDGSVEGDLPAHIMERLFNVNNFIVSQVNPHVAPFLPKEEDTPDGRTPAVAGFMHRAMRVCAANSIWCLDGLLDRGWDALPIKMAHSVLSQRYDGDITIMPDISWVSWLQVLANPSEDFIREATRQGEKATWPKLDRIRNHVAIELALSNGIKHIQGAKIAPRMRSTLGRKGPTSVKSERDMTRMRHHRTGGFEPLSRRQQSPVRGRSQGHFQRRSMVEPTDLLTQVGAFAPARFARATTTDLARPTTSGADAVQLSSSDERASGRSSPSTSYDDEDFEDVINTPPFGRSNTTAGEISASASAARSHPGTPHKSFTFDVAENAPAFTPALSPRQPATLPPELRRVLNELNMSSIEIKPPPAERKRQKK